MAESDGQEKTEQPTSKRLSDARKKGQIPRSREAGTLFVLLSGVIALYVLAPFIGKGFVGVFNTSLQLTRDQVFTIDEMKRVFLTDLMLVAIPLFTACMIMLIFALIGSIFLGGISFSQEAMMPKFSKLNPLAGLKRMISLNSLVELVKSIAKVTFIATLSYFIIKAYTPDILSLSYIDVNSAISKAINLLFILMLVIVCAMVPIVLIDVPFQIWNYHKQLRMSKQEIKDEYKEVEGNPQIKNRIRRMQYEMASRRMMSNVPEADVVVTNPTHYAVALSYDPNGSLAPVVVAKGIDEVAEKIKEIAREYDIPVLTLPPLARSIYYTTDLDKEIPKGLFKAVAQVLAYVLGMKAFKEGKSPKPRDLDSNLPIPDELQF